MTIDRRQLESMSREDLVREATKVGVSDPEELERRELVEEILARPERAARRARNLEIAGWIIPLLLERGGVTYLDATYISAVTGTALLSRRLPLVTPTGVEEQRFPWEPRAED